MSNIGIGIGIDGDKIVLIAKATIPADKNDDKNDDKNGRPVDIIVEKKLSLEEAKVLKNNLRYYIEDLAENIRIMKKEKREPWHIKTTWL